MIINPFTSEVLNVSPEKKLAASKQLDRLGGTIVPKTGMKSAGRKYRKLQKIAGRTTLGDAIEAERKNLMRLSKRVGDKGYQYMGY